MNSSMCMIPSNSELKQWELASESMKDLKPSNVNDSILQSAANYGISTALAEAMVLPISMVIP